MRPFGTLLLGLAVLGMSPAAAQVFPDGPRIGSPVHEYDFEEGGTHYALSSRNEIVVPHHVAVAREVIRHCAGVLIIQILPLNTPRDTAEQLRRQARQECQQRQLAAMKDQGYLPADALLTRR
jgi:hypothetical protein